MKPERIDDSSFISVGLLNPEVKQRWTIAELHSCSWLSNQHLPQAYEPVALNIDDIWTSPNGNNLSSSTSQSSSLEGAVYLRLENLGITREILQTITENPDKKHRLNYDHINGTYRILLHRLQKQKHQLEDDHSHNEKPKYHRTSSSPNHRSLPRHENNRRQNAINENKTELQDTKICTIL